MCLRTIFADNRGNWFPPERYPLSTARRNVVGGGLPKQAWTNWTYFSFVRVSSCRSKARTVVFCGFGIGDAGSEGLKVRGRVIVSAVPLSGQ